MPRDDEPIRKQLAAISDLSAPEHSHKIPVMMTILDICASRNEKVLLFGRSIPTLDFLERIIKEKYRVFRMDGSTPIPGRLQMVNSFNKDKNFSVFMISTKTGGVGINLASATRVVLFDIGWNPSDDEQAIARAYRYGQTKEVFVYRLQTYDTWEHHLFKNNVHKVGLAMRVVDKTATERHFDKKEMKSYFKGPDYEAHCSLPDRIEFRDPVALEVVGRHREKIVRFIAHKDLLGLVDEALDEEEQRDAEELFRSEVDRLARNNAEPDLPPTTAPATTVSTPSATAATANATALPSSAAFITTTTALSAGSASSSSAVPQGPVPVLATTTIPSSKYVIRLPNP